MLVAFSVFSFFFLLYLLWRLDGGESGRGGVEDTSDKGGDCDVLHCANGTSTHGLGGSGIVISLLDKTHIVLCGVCVWEVLLEGVGVKV